MQLKEGRCPNCGSILQLDADAEKGHCLFCDAVFENEEAFEIAKNPSAYTFPNLPQPKYEGPSLDPKVTAGAAQQVKKAKKKEKPPPPPFYVPKEPVELPDISLPTKVKVRILLISLAVIIAIVGISAPIIKKRDSIRAELISDMQALAPFSIDPEQAVAIWYTSNSYVMAATPDTVESDDVLVFYKAYCEKRAELYGLDPTNFEKVYGQVSVKLVYPKGGYLVDRPDSQEALESGKGLKVLP